MTKSNFKKNYNFFSFQNFVIKLKKIEKLINFLQNDLQIFLHTLVHRENLYQFSIIIEAREYKR